MRQEKKSKKCSQISTCPCDGNRGNHHLDYDGVQDLFQQDC